MDPGGHHQAEGVRPEVGLGLEEGPGGGVPDQNGGADRGQVLHPQARPDEEEQGLHGGRRAEAGPVPGQLERPRGRGGRREESAAEVVNLVSVKHIDDRDNVRPLGVEHHTHREAFKGSYYVMFFILKYFFQFLK